MAEGLLLILEDKECLQREKFQSLKKTYEFKALFGVETDTYDLMGIPTFHSKAIKITASDLKKNVSFAPRKFIQRYPPYSSKRLNGKPLFYLSRKKLIEQSNLPKKEVEVYSFKFLKTQDITSKELEEYILNNVLRVRGNFRQQEIVDYWKKKLALESQLFQIFSFEIECSSGFYVRSLVNSIGEKLNTKATTFSILRTKIGDYSLNHKNVISL